MRRTVTALNHYYYPAFKGGGPIRTLQAMVESYADVLQFRIVTSNYDLGESLPLPVEPDKWTQIGHEFCYYINMDRKASKIRGILAALNRDDDYLYLNSLFSPMFSIFPLLLVKLGIGRPKVVVLAVRGELGEGAMALKRPKEVAFIRAAKMLRLHNEIYWHASTRREMNEILNWFPTANVTVRSNEVNLPMQRQLNITSASESDVLQAVYVGRISRKKGLETALDALKKVSRAVEFDVYGGFEDTAYEKELDEHCRGLPSNIKVRFMGALPNAYVRDVFAKSDVFLFPTTHENFGHTIVESLYSSCPVIMADVTPFTAAVVEGGGEVLQANQVDRWAEAINKYASLSADERHGRKLLAGAAYENWRRRQSGESVFEPIQAKVSQAQAVRRD